MFLFERLRRGAVVPLVVITATGLAGCDIFDDDDDPVAIAPPVLLEQFKLQVLHASADAPAVNVLVDGAETLSNVDFKQGSGQLTLDEGDYEIQVDGIVPTGTATVIGPVTLSFEPNQLYSVIALNDVAAIEPLVLSQPDDAVPAGSVRARVVHAAPAAPEVDVYVTAPGTDLATEMPLGTFEFGGDLGPVDVPAADYQIRVTAAGDPTAVVFDSGTVPLPDGGNLLIAAVANTGTGDAPISLALLDGTGASEILDTTTPADLRVIHASPDAPAVDVIANDGFAAPLVEDLAFEGVTGFLSVPPADYNIKVTPADNAGVIVIDADVTLEAAETYSVVAVGLLADIEPLILAEDPRPVATAAKVRIVHGAPSAPDVDIYVTAQGADITAETPAFTSVAFKASTGFVELAAGDYDVTVTVAGDNTAIAIGPAAISIADGGIYTAIARDATGGGGPFGLILADDFVAAPMQ